MHVELHNVWAYVTNTTRAERIWLDGYTSCEAPVFRMPDEVYRMLDQSCGQLRFPAGLALRMRSAAKRDGISATIVDRRVAPCTPDLDPALLSWLRPYQVDAVLAVARKGGRGLIKVPTGGGKTEIFIGLTRVLPCEWLFVVHRADLVKQAADRYLMRTGESAGTWTGHWTKGTSNVNVATFQSLYSALRKKDPAVKQFLAAMQAVNVDEAHAQPAASFYSVAMQLSSAYYRVGQSGTPMVRSDVASMRTIAALGPMLYELPTATLIDAGVLASAHVKMLAYTHPIRQVSPEWPELYRSGIVHNQTRNELIIDMITAAAKPCLVFVDERAHGDWLVNAATRAGWRVGFAQGEDPVSVRTSKLAALGAGELDVLVCTVIFQEGIDLPSLASVVVAAGKSSAVATLQRIGRGMRRAAGKVHFEVWDVLDIGGVLGNHARTRRRTYDAEGHAVTVCTPKEIRKHCAIPAQL